MSQRNKHALLRRIIASFSVFVLFSTSTAFVGCASDGAVGGTNASSDTPFTVRVAAMKGPTSIGLVHFMNEERQTNASENTDYRYDFQILEPPDIILADLAKGELDIALIPANTAALLHQKTDGEIQVLNITTLGVLYVVSADQSINSFDDLSGRTVLMTGKGATPEYAMNTLLAQSGIENVRLEYKTEITELASAIVADPNAVAVVPEPFVSVVLGKDPSLAVCVSLTDVWDELVADDSQLVTGVTVVRRSFAAEHPEAVSEFLARQTDSVSVAKTDAAYAAQLVVDFGIIDNAEVVESAIPRCNLVCMVGDELQQTLGGYLAALYQQDPASIGGEIPDSSLYYEGSQ